MGIQDLCKMMRRTVEKNHPLKQADCGSVDNFFISACPGAMSEYTGINVPSPLNYIEDTGDHCTILPI